MKVKATAKFLRHSTRKTRLVTAFEDYCVTFFAREFGKS